MKKDNLHTLHGFERKIFLTFALRRSALWMTYWFLCWGAISLISRIIWQAPSSFLSLGCAGVIPVVVAASWTEWKRRPNSSSIRAKLDRYNGMGGLYLASESHDLSAWKIQEAKSAPKLVWKSGKSLSWLSASALFAAVCLLIPDRFTTMADAGTMDLGHLVDDTQKQIEVLEEETILDLDEADRRREELKKIEENSRAEDPGRTWEALDQLQKRNEDKAKEAAEEMIEKLQSLAESETLMAALSEMTENSAAKESAMEAMSDLMNENLGSWMSGLTGNMTPEALKNEIKKSLSDNKESGPLSEKLSEEDLKKLLEALRAMKSNLNNSAKELADLKLIDLKKLGECNSAGECKNPKGLAKFLAECNSKDKKEAMACLMSYCRGGVNRGRGDAPMLWGDESNEEGAGFKDSLLQGQPDFSQAEMIGVSKAAPELSNPNEVSQSGALANSQAGGGSAQTQVVLPRYQSTVRSYFNRSQPGTVTSED